MSKYKIMRSKFVYNIDLIAICLISNTFFKTSFALIEKYKVLVSKNLLDIHIFLKSNTYI